MLTVTKTIISTVLLSVLLAKANTVEARLKYYRYNADIPMVEMSLNMMVAMGVLDQIPGRLVHDGNPYNRLASAKYSPYSRSSYNRPASTRYYDKYRYGGYFDDYFGNNYFGNGYYGDYSDGPISPYSRYRSRYDYADPWSRSWDSPWASRWGSPWNSSRSGPWGNDYWANNSWGNPWNTTNTWGNPWNTTSTWGNPWNSYSAWGSPWGNAWNSQWMNPWSIPPGYLGSVPFTQSYPTVPLLPESLLGDEWWNDHSESGNSSSRQQQNNKSYQQQDNKGYQQQNNKGYSAEKTSWSGRPSRASYTHAWKPASKRNSYRKLNGLWIGDNGEMLGIRGNRFLWYDDEHQYAKGQLLKSPTMMKAKVEGTNQVARFQYRLIGDEMVIMSRGGKIRTFNRMPLMYSYRALAQPRVAYSSYTPGSDSAYFSRSKFRPDVTGARDAYVPDTDSPAGTVMPHKYARPATAPQNLHISYTRRNSARSAAITPRTENSGASRAIGQQAGRDTAALSSRAGSVDMTGKYKTPIYPQHKSAADTLESSVRTSSGPTSAAFSQEPGHSASTSAAVLDQNDPNTYLYSYLKDSRSFSASDADDDLYSAHSGMADENDNSNIWKPSERWLRQQNSQSEAVSSEAGKLTWTEPDAWN